MAISKVSSSIITNKFAMPPVRNAIGAESSGKVRVIQGSMEVATTSIDEIGDVVLMFPVQGNERIVSLKIFNDDMDSNGSPALAADVGLYKDVNAAGTAATVVDADAYASAITTLQAANAVGVEVMCEARDIANIGRTVAADGGESAHCNPRYVGLTITAAAATAVAGTLSWVALVVEP